MYTRSVIAATAVALAVLGCQNEPTAPRAEIPLRSASASRPLEGWFHVLWVDPVARNGPETVRYELVDDRGRGTELELASGLAAQWGGPRGLDGRKVRVHGTQVGGGRVRVRSIEPVAKVDAQASSPRIGSLPFVTILCKFSDIATEPSKAPFIQWMTWPTYPELDHYWRENSYNQMNLAGSIVVGWYTLPYPISHYYDPVTGSLGLSELLTDCTAAADPQVNFPQFYGINLQFNGSFNAAYGVNGWTLTADGQTKSYGITWQSYDPNTEMPNRALYAHEIGHALGLPHSGPGSAWDGAAWGSWGNPVPGPVPDHRISFHKDLLGWVPASRKLAVGPNTTRTITLERLALPGPGNYLMAQIPMENVPGQFYTVEARRRAGYDDSIPGEAVILHQVDPSLQRPFPAQLVGDWVDAAWMWTPGETFTDATNGITVTVNARTATGFQVTIRGSRTSALWISRTSMPTARRSFAVAVANGGVYAIGGENGAGRVLRTVEWYDPARNGWTIEAPLPAARQGGNGAAALNGILYLAGGKNGAGALTRTLYAYNPSTGAWSTRAPMPVYGACGGSAVISGMLYVFSGCTRSSTGAEINAGLLHRYDPATNTWTTLKSAPVTRFRPAVAAIGGKLYVMGGNNASGTAIRRVDMYDPATNTWSGRSGMPTPRMSAGATSMGGRLYVFGGRNGTAYLSTVEVYDPVANTWTSGPAMPTARMSLGVGGVNGLIYVIGGRNATAALDANERFTP